MNADVFGVKPKLPVMVGGGVGAVKPVLQPEPEPPQPAPGKPAAPVEPPAQPPAQPPDQPPPPAGHPDGEIDPLTGGIWYQGHLYTNPHNLAALFKSDDDWRAFLNANTVYRDWNAKWAAANPTGPAGGGGGGAAQSVDWATIYWGGLGLPPDVVAQINKIFGLYPDQTVAFQVAQNYLRQTDWYAKTFPGIAYGVRNGLFSDEAGYRSYVNDLNNLYQQYQSRAVTGDEVAQWLAQGKNSEFVGRAFKGNAIAQTEGPERQYEAGAFTQQGRLSPGELTAYGQEQAGIDTPLGQQITMRLQQAQQRLNRIFQGTLATPNLSLGPQGLFSPDMQGRSGKPDIGA